MGLLSVNTMDFCFFLCLLERLEVYHDGEGLNICPFCTLVMRASGLGETFMHEFKKTVIYPLNQHQSGKQGDCRRD